MKAPPGYLERIDKADRDVKQERVRPPTPAEEAVMAAHLRRPPHDVKSFDLKRHVYLGGRRTPSQVLTYDPARARFFCEACPGVFVTGEQSPELVELAQRFDPNLQAHLVGLSPEERDEMTRRYLGGELNELALRRLRAAASRRHAAAAARPMVEERYRKVEAWMLERYADHGVVERVLDEAERMQRDDPDAWHRIAGWPLVRGTLRKYWHRIDSRRQQQAYAEFARRRRARS